MKYPELDLIVVRPILCQGHCSYAHTEIHHSALYVILVVGAESSSISIEFHLLACLAFREQIRRLQVLSG